MDHGGHQRRVAPKHAVERGDDAVRARPGELLSVQTGLAQEEPGVEIVGIIPLKRARGVQRGGLAPLIEAMNLEDPAVARRQVYISGWYDGRLVADPDERDRRLAVNAAVLGGGCDPERIEYSQSFGSYWAVVEAARRVPGGFRRTYENEEFALYRIESYRPSVRSTIRACE